MHHLRTTLGATASIIALGLVGCSSSGSTETPADPPETSSAVPTSKANPGPEIAQPKDLAAIKDGCQLLKPNQAQQLGATAPQSRESVAGPSCTWEQGETRITLTASTGVAGTFGETPDDEMDGYPFVKRTSTLTSCGLRFAAADQETLVVTAFTEPDSPTPPCELAKQAAGMAITNLPPAA